MVREIPTSYLEADMQEFDLKDAMLPAEVVYMLRSVRYECFLFIFTKIKVNF